LSGIGIYYGDSPVGVPPILTHFLRNVDAMHDVTIFLTVRFLPMPYIKNAERLLVRAVKGVPNFYQVVSRYGYQEVVDHGTSFISQVISTIMHKLELKSGLKYRGLQDDYMAELEGDDYRVSPFAYRL
jgi:K+ transporter